MNRMKWRTGVSSSVEKRMTKRNMYFTYICAMVIGAAFLMHMLLEILYGVPSFDGAMNLQVPSSLLSKGKWMTTYDGGIMFDNKIQTRMPVLLPIYLLWCIMGVHIEIAILVNVLYIFLLLAGVWMLCKQLEIGQDICCCLLMLIVVTPFFNEFSLGVYGEIPTLALFILSDVMLIKGEKKEGVKWYSYSGIFYSLACLNKTVILIALPSYILIFLVKLLWDKSIRIKAICVWGGSYILPIVLFEIFHLLQMGGVKAYINGWKIEIIDIVQQAGVTEKYKDTPNIFIKFWTHINIFCDDFGFALGPVVFIALLAGVFVYWLYRFFVKQEHTYYSIIVLVMCSYFGWWTLISTTEMAWPRRILIGVILLKIVIAYDLSLLLDKKAGNFVRGVVLFCISVFTMIQIINQCSSIDRNIKQEVKGTGEIIAEIDEKEEAVFYGFGWWQAPVLSLYSGVPFYNIENISELPENAYLIIDFYAKNLAQEELGQILQKYDTEIINKHGNSLIYKLTPSSVDELEYQSVFDAINNEEVLSEYDVRESYSYIDGVYEYEADNGSRWASQKVEILLKKNAEHNILKVNMTAVNIENMLSDDPVLFIYMNGVLLQKEYIQTEGNREISILLPDECTEDGVMDIHLILNTKLKTNNNDTRELGYLLKFIGFEENEDI